MADIEEPDKGGDDGGVLDDDSTRIRFESPRKTLPMFAMGITVEIKQSWTAKNN